MIPSYGKLLAENPELLEKVHAETSEVLGLNKADSNEMAIG